MPGSIGGRSTSMIPKAIRSNWSATIRTWCRRRTPLTHAVSEWLEQEARGSLRLLRAFFLLAEAMMAEKAASSLSIPVCRLEDIESVLELWRQADATPGVTDTADDLRRAIVESPA